MRWGGCWECGGVEFNRWQVYNNPIPGVDRMVVLMMEWREGKGASFDRTNNPTLLYEYMTANDNHALMAAAAVPLRGFGKK